MLTINCNAHPVLRLMHRPDVAAAGVQLPDDQQHKRTVVALEPSALEAWQHGSAADAASLIHLPAADLQVHGPADPGRRVALPIEGSLA